MKGGESRLVSLPAFFLFLLLPSDLSGLCPKVNTPQSLMNSVSVAARCTFALHAVRGRVHGCVRVHVESTSVARMR